MGLFYYSSSFCGNLSNSDYLLSSLNKSGNENKIEQKNIKNVPVSGTIMKLKSRRIFIETYTKKISFIFDIVDF